MPASAQSDASLYRGHRYPSDIIGHAVWLYLRFSLRLRDVEELLAERGVTVSYEAIRGWCAKFGPTYALQLRRRRPHPSDKWHLDEVRLKIKGKRHWLWRAVDKHGVVLDILVHQRRDQHAAETFLRVCSQRRGANHGWCACAGPLWAGFPANGYWEQRLHSWARKPGGQAVRCAVRQQIDDFVCFEVHEDGAKDVPLALRPVINTQSHNWLNLGQRSRAHQAQQRSSADRHARGGCMARPRVTA